MATLYPGMYSGETQSQETIPEPEEQAALTNLDSPAPPPVDAKKKLNMFTLFIALFALLFLFGKG